MKLMLYLLSALLLAGCTTPEKIELGNDNYGQVPIDIYLIPMEGISMAYASSLAKEIESRHGLRTKAITTMGRDAAMFSEEHRQYIANVIARHVNEVIKNLKQPNEQPFVLVLTPNDINSEEFNLRFLFAAHYKGLSVISTARIDPVNYGLPKDEKLRDARLMKLINKAIGQQVRHYPISTDRKTVMYGPIMGLDDLDSIGIWYDR